MGQRQRAHTTWTDGAGCLQQTKVAWSVQGSYCDVYVSQLFNILFLTYHGIKYIDICFIVDLEGKNNKYMNDTHKYIS